VLLIHYSPLNFQRSSKKKVKWLRAMLMESNWQKHRKVTPKLPKHSAPFPLGHRCKPKKIEV
jgi:hypothetical protein